MNKSFLNPTSKSFIYLYRLFLIIFFKFEVVEASSSVEKKGWLKYSSHDNLFLGSSTSNLSIKSFNKGSLACL